MSVITKNIGLHDISYAIVMRILSVYPLIVQGEGRYKTKERWPL